MMTNPPFLKAGVALLLALAAACGDDDGSAGDGSAGDAGTSGSSAGGSSGRAGSPTGGMSTDGEAGAGGDTESGTPAGAGGEAQESPLAVDLGTAEDYVVLAKSAISTVPISVITGDVGVSPAAASYITGFSLTVDSTDAFSTSAQVTGRVYAADYTSPTPSKMTTAVRDMELAFTDAAGRAPDVTELGAGNIGGMTLNPGVYKWGTGLLIPTDITLRGDRNGVWIFQIAQDLTMSSAARIVLAGGALAQNVFWQIDGQVELGTTAHFEGVVLTQTSVTLGTGASLNGRLLAQTAVALDGNTLVEPAQ